MIAKLSEEDEHTHTHDRTFKSSENTYEKAINEEIAERVIGNLMSLRSFSCVQSGKKHIQTLAAATIQIQLDVLN